MSRTAVFVGMLVWAGATLLLGEWRRLSRPSLAERLRPYNPVGAVTKSPSGLLSVESLRDVVGPLAREIGTRLSALFGITESAELRLARIHSALGVTEFRVRQLAWTGAGLVAGVLAAVFGLPWPLVLLGTIGGPLLAFLVCEQRLISASSRWQERVRWELPVVSEQLAMLLAAGFSLGAAMNRVAQQGTGCCARDLAVVTNRVRHGLSEVEALREWAQVVRVDGVDRLVGVLALNSEASDLGRLVSAEARQGRRELHRRTTELLERRAQQVWVPVTVATLVPGVIFLAIPFIAALRLFSNA